MIPATGSGGEDGSAASLHRLQDIIAACLLLREERGTIHRRKVARLYPELSGAAIDFICDTLDTLGALDPTGLDPSALSLTAIADDPIDDEATAGRSAVVPAPDAGLTDGYEILEPIGVGGSGEVFRARVRGLDGEIALKLLRHGQRLHVSRDLRNAIVLHGFEHPHIVRVLAAGVSTAGREFLAMEFVEGTNLAEWVRAHGPLDEKAAAGIALVLSNALDAAHAQGIVHGDVKPSNVFGCRSPVDSWRLKLGDFGLSRYVRDGDGKVGQDAPVLGTVGCIAPEQYYGQPERRSDIYALGILLVSVVAGSASPQELLRARQYAALDALRDEMRRSHGFAERRARVVAVFDSADLAGLCGQVRDEGLRAIVRRCVAIDPDDRYESAARLADDLSAWLEHRPPAPETRRVGPSERLVMLASRCRHRDDVMDHSKLWGLAYLASGAIAITFSTLCTLLLLLGHDPAPVRRWTASVYIGLVWLVVYPAAIWLTRFRGPVFQLFGYNVIYLISYFTIRAFIDDRGTADAFQFFLTGVVLGSIGLANTTWSILLYAGLFLMFASWPIMLVSGRPWFDQVAPLLLGLAQGLPMLGFGVSFLKPMDARARR